MTFNFFPKCHEYIIVLYTKSNVVICSASNETSLYMGRFYQVNNIGAFNSICYKPKPVVFLFQKFVSKNFCQDICSTFYILKC